MKVLIKMMLAVSFIGWIACGSDKTPSNQQDTTAERGLDTTPAPAATQPATHNCTIQGSVLEGNQFWARDMEILIAIVADSTTYDQNLQAESHRILEVYNTKDCSRILRQTLPVDVSADFPYYLAEITYNHVTKIVAIRGTTIIYLYDLQNRKLLPKLTPKFRSERYAVDAQSGHIQRLEVWESYLIGYCQDYGVFAFDLSDRQNPKPVMPFAEYALDEVNFAPLFLVPSQNDGTQAIMPAYNIETGEFAIHPAFDQPMNLNTNVQRSATNNRYLVLREEGTNNAVAFDLQQHERIELPADVTAKSTQDVLKWIRSNVQ